jgi:hypothetical protein
MRAALLACALSLPLLCGAQSAPAGKLMLPAALRGTLGSDQIQMNLRAKQEFEDGIEGEYFLFGGSRNVLLAGEIEDGEVFMEESENGTDVSGQWNGKLDGELFNGEWTSADGAVKKPFNIFIVRAAEKVKRAATGKP